MRVWLESAFDLIYLTTVIYIGFSLYRKSGSASGRLFGVMALVLGGGDAFHLIPRVAALVSGRGFLLCYFILCLSGQIPGERPEGCNFDDLFLGGGPDRGLPFPAK